MAVSGQSTIQGFAPVFQQVADFAFGEVPGASGGTAYNNTGLTKIDFFTPKGLVRRKVYGYISISGTACVARIQFLLNKSNVGSLPLIAGVSPNGLGTSLASLFSVTTTAIQDSINLILNNPVNGQVTSNILNPLYINGVFDEVQVFIDRTVALTDVRIWVGVVSN